MARPLRGLASRRTGKFQAVLPARRSLGAGGNEVKAKSGLFFNKIMSGRSSDGAGIILLIGAAFGLLWSLFKYPIPTIIGINLLTLIVSPDNFGTIFWISVVVVIIYYFIKKSNKDTKQKEENKKIEEKFGPRVADRSKSIIERNEDIIQKNLSNLHTDSWPHYVENKVRDCLMDIALAEGKKQFSPTATTS